MPQLDTVTFFSQFFWLSFFFLGFYGILVKYYLPKMSRILKIRTRKMTLASSGSSTDKSVDFVNENTSLRQHIDTSLSLSLRNSYDFLNKKIKNTSQWTQETIDSTNKNQLQKLNLKYLTTIGEIQVSDVLLFQHLKSVISPKCFQDSINFHNLSSKNEDFILQKKSREKSYDFFLLKNLLK